MRDSTGRDAPTPVRTDVPVRVTTGSHAAFLKAVKDAISIGLLDGLHDVAVTSDGYVMHVTATGTPKVTYAYPDDGEGEVYCDVLARLEQIARLTGVGIADDDWGIDGADDQPDDANAAYTRKVANAILSSLGPGQTVGIFRPHACAFCMRCNGLLLVLPSGAPAPDSGVFDHTCPAELAPSLHESPQGPTND